MLILLGSHSQALRCSYRNNLAWQARGRCQTLQQDTCRGKWILAGRRSHGDKLGKKRWTLRQGYRCSFHQGKVWVKTSSEDKMTLQGKVCRQWHSKKESRSLPRTPRTWR